MRAFGTAPEAPRRGFHLNHTRLRAGLVACVSIAILAGGLATAPPALAAVPGENGRIVFVRDGHGIYTMNPNGSGVIQLTNSDTDLFPRWSPDGRKIAFSSNRASTHPHIYTISADGSGLTDLTPSGWGAAPAWSPDGTKIAFGQWGGIFVMNSDGSDVTQISSGEDDGMPTWSPDGTRITFDRFDSEASAWRIWIMNSDGSGQAPLTDGPGDHYSDWSPDGTKIVFDRWNGPQPQIYSVNPDGSGQIPLTGTGSLSPNWSPDGTKIGFTKFSDSGFWVMNPDGSGQTRLSSNYVSYPMWQPLQVRLSVSSTKVEYNQPVTVTAHLPWYETSSNLTVSIYKTPYGRAKTLVASGVVDANGNLTASVVLTQKTVLSAEWSGDADHPAGGISNSKTVTVYAKVTGKLSGAYGSSGKYKLYHYSKYCPESGKRCPTYVASVAPNHQGKYVYFTLQTYKNAAWRTVLSFRYRLTAESKRGVRFIYANREIIGIRWRVRGQFKGDADHLAKTSAWSYFKVTN